MVNNTHPSLWTIIRWLDEDRALWTLTDRENANEQFFAEVSDVGLHRFSSWYITDMLE